VPAQNSESINHAVKHTANQQGLLKDDDGLVAVLQSTMSVLERGEVEAMKKLERDLQQGLGVSREYTTELTKAIGRVAGIECNVVGTFTITTTEGDPAVGPCRYVVQHCTVRTHTIVVYYERTGYTARYSAQELTSGDDRDQREPVAAIAVDALVRLASQCCFVRVSRCQCGQVRNGYHGDGKVTRIYPSTRTTVHDCEFHFDVHRITGMKTAKQFPTCSCSVSKTSTLPCVGMLYVMCSDKKINPHDPSYARSRMQLKLHPCAPAVAAKLGIDLELDERSVTPGGVGTTVYMMEGSEADPGSANRGLVVVGNAAIKASMLTEIERSMSRDTTYQSVYRQLQEGFKQCTNLVEGHPHLAPFLMASLRAVQEQLAHRRNNRSLATVSTVRIHDAGTEAPQQVERTLGAGHGPSGGLVRNTNVTPNVATASKAKKRPASGGSPQREACARQGGHCKKCERLGVEDANTVFNHKSAAKCLFNPVKSKYGENFAISHVVDIPAAHASDTRLEAHFETGRTPLYFTLDTKRFPSGTAHRVRVVNNSARWVFSAEYDRDLTELCRACCPEAEQENFALP